MSDFHFQEMFELGADETPYRKLTSEHVSTAEFEGQRILKVEAEALTGLAAQAMRAAVRGGSSSSPARGMGTHRFSSSG